MIDAAENSLFAHPPIADAGAFADRVLYHARRLGCTGETLAGLRGFLEDGVTRGVLALPDDALNALLVNDLYKARMHSLYASCMGGMRLTFQLQVRRTPAPLLQIRREDPELWAAFEGECRRRLGVAPYPPPVQEALATHYAGFRLPQDALLRARRDGVAALEWEELGGQLIGFAESPAEAASHVETTLTQLIQVTDITCVLPFIGETGPMEVTIAVQLRRWQRERGLAPGPAPHTELLAAALGRLAAGVERLNSEVEGSPGMVLFAGRRSSSRRYLLLQNWYCSNHLRGYGGTSSLVAAALLGELVLAQEQRQAPAGDVRAPAAGAGGGGAGAAEEARRAWERRRRREAVGPLVGTLAHEVMMAVDQLLGCYDDVDAFAISGGGGGTGPGQGGGPRRHDEGGGPGAAGYDPGPAQVCSLLAHLLILREAGGLASASALPDTFGTRGFVSAALAARLPPAFEADMQQRYPAEWAGSYAAAAAAADPGAPLRVFDLFAVWRMDSGSYEEIAAYVLAAWEARWAGAPPAARPPRPRFMHSNLDRRVSCGLPACLPRHGAEGIGRFTTLQGGREGHQAAKDSLNRARRIASYQDIIDCSRLPPTIRPAAFAFGTLADGFPPLDLSHLALAPALTSGSDGVDGRGRGAPSPAGASTASDGSQGAGPGGRGSSASASGSKLQVELASVVMKAASHPGMAHCSTPSAGKLGDGSGSKEATRARLLELSKERRLDPDVVSAALAAAYHAVTRAGVLG
eukprot:scaffold12.g8268.t1